MNTKVQAVLATLIVFTVAYISIMGIAGDGWYHDAYCFGRVDALDPWCP